MRNITRSLFARLETFFFSLIYYYLLLADDNFFVSDFLLFVAISCCAKNLIRCSLRCHIAIHLSILPTLFRFVIRSFVFAKMVFVNYYYHRFDLKWSHVASIKTELNIIKDFLLRRFHLLIDIILNNKPASQWDNRP